MYPSAGRLRKTGRKSSRCLGAAGGLCGASPMHTASIISGYVSVDKFSFTINIPIEGNPTDVVFTGTFDGSTLKGNIDVMGFSIEFTGTKPSSQAAATSGSAIEGRTRSDSSVAGGAQ